MSELEIRVMDLIRQKKTNREICNVLKIDFMTLKDILLGLRTKGILYKRKFKLDGSTLYIPNQDLYGSSSKGVDILTSSNVIRTILLSDLHLGTQEERLDLLNLVYEYASKERIHIIINGGDLINGLTPERHNVVETMMEQCEYFIEKHPFDKNILNVCVLGNHDIKSLTTEGINFGVLLENCRPDFAIAGVGKGQINLKDDSIYLYHPLSCNEKVKGLERVALIGHSHHYKVKVNNGDIAIYIPALSNYVPLNSGVMPSFLVMEVLLYGGYLKKIKLQNLTFVDKKVNYLGAQELEVKKVLKQS